MTRFKSYCNSFNVDFALFFNDDFEKISLQIQVLWLVCHFHHIYHPWIAICTFYDFQVFGERCFNIFLKLIILKINYPQGIYHNLGWEPCFQFVHKGCYKIATMFFIEIITFLNICLVTQNTPLLIKSLCITHMCCLEQSNFKWLVILVRSMIYFIYDALMFNLNQRIENVENRGLENCGWIAIHVINILLEKNPYCNLCKAIKSVFYNYIGLFWWPKHSQTTLLVVLDKSQHGLFY
jgi:hypothetical protein